MRRLVAVICIIISIQSYALSNLLSFDNQSDEKRFQQLTGELRCLVCQNQSLADSNATLAEDLRREIYLQIVDGRSNTEIKEFLMDRYGDFVLYKPPINLKNLLLWIGPFFMLLIGFGSLKNKIKYKA